MPFFCVLTTSPQVSEQLGKRHKTVAMWAQQMISLVRSFLPDRAIKLMGDTAYSVLELGLHAKPQRVTLVTTGRLDAVLHEPPEDTHPTHHWPSSCCRQTPANSRTGLILFQERSDMLLCYAVSQQAGCLTGTYHFLPERVLQDPQTVWQKLTLDWYGEGERTLEICTGTALWYRYGSDPLPIRWVLTRDPLGKRPPKAIFSTDPAQPAEEIIKDFMKRSRLEVTCEEGRALWSLQSRDPLWASVAPGWTDPGCSSDLVSQAGRHLA
ncbi:MAG TPA: hypothetical protein VFA10_31560 [Ktedonobacteraceae bacterium]|nr:hypothetical protein [Ktedonobacteraceae bacterium]